MWYISQGQVSINPTFGLLESKLFDHHLIRSIGINLKMEDSMMGIIDLFLNKEMGSFISKR
jgi:hypothetical protein